MLYLICQNRKSSQSCLHHFPVTYFSLAHCSFYCFRIVLYPMIKPVCSSAGELWIRLRCSNRTEGAGLGETGETRNLNNLNNYPPSNAQAAHQVTSRSFLVVCREAGQGAPGATAVGGRPRGLRVLPVRGALGSPAEQVDRLANTALNVDLWKGFKEKTRKARAKYQ